MTGHKLLNISVFKIVWVKNVFDVEHVTPPVHFGICLNWQVSRFLRATKYKIVKYPLKKH